MYNEGMKIEKYLPRYNIGYSSNCWIAQRAWLQSEESNIKRRTKVKTKMLSIIRELRNAYFFPHSLTLLCYVPYTHALQRTIHCTLRKVLNNHALPHNFSPCFYFPGGPCPTHLQYTFFFLRHSSRSSMV